MADENAVLEAETIASEGEIPGFGNIKDAFDGAFPATAEKSEVEAPLPVQAEPVAAEPEPKPELVVAAPKKAAEPGGMPEEVFGDRKAKADETVTPEPEIKMPASITKPKDIESWKGLRTAYETEKTARARERAEFQKARDEAKANATDADAKARIEALSQENLRLSQTVERRDLQEHPAFLQNISMPRERAMEEGRTLLQEANVDPRQLDKAMSLQGQARIEALNDLYENLPEAAKVELAGAVREVKRLDARGYELLKNAHDELTKLQKGDSISRHEMLQQQEQQFVKMATAAAEHLRDEQGFEAFRKVDDPAFESWNKQVEERLSDARDLLTKERDPAKHAIAANLAVACPFYREQMLHYRDRALKAEKTIADERAAEPRLDGDGENGKLPDDDEKLTFAERVARDSGLR